LRKSLLGVIEMVAAMRSLPLTRLIIPGIRQLSMIFH